MSSSSDNEEESCGSDVEKIRQRGNGAFKKKLYKKAVRFYSAGIEIDDSIVALWSNRAMTYAAQELWSKSEADARRVLKLDPTHVKGRFHLIKALIRLQRYEEALYEGARQDNPSQELEDLLGDAAIMEARMRVTKNTSNKFEGTEEQFTDLHKRGMELMQKRQFLDAIECFEGAIAIGVDKKNDKFVDNLLECYSCLARCFMHLGRPMEAGIIFQPLKSLQERFLGESGRSKVAITMNNIGICAKQCGQYEDALRVLTEAWNILTKSNYNETCQPELPSILNNLGSIHMHLGNIEDAYKVYAHSTTVTTAMYHEEHGTVAIDYLSLARCCVRLNKFSEAHNLYEKCLNVWTKRNWNEVLNETPAGKHPDQLKKLVDQAKAEFERLKTFKDTELPKESTTKIEELDERDSGLVAAVD